MASKERFYVDIMAMNQEVTGSCNLVIVKLPNGETIRFVVDCGLFQEKQYEELNQTLPFHPEDVEFCLITHNHVDHTGRIPFMVEKGFCKEIYATETTCKLLPLALYDNLKVLRDVSKRKNVKCLYKDEDVERAIDLLKPCEINQTFKIGNYIKVTFLSNGHLLGAASILIQISYPKCETINILFSGDYNNKNMFFNVKKIPAWVRRLPLTVIQESTYGDMDTSEIKRCFKENILECIKENGTVVAPVFSLGRAQEILYELKCMQKSKKLDVEVPIYFDGKLAMKYTNLYLKGELEIKDNMKDFLPENITFVNKENREEVLLSKEKKIIVTTSGMGSYGPAQLYIPEYIRRKGALIHFTGYTAEGTLGANLKNAEFGETVEFGGCLLVKRAKVEYTNEYSAHAKSDEMIEFLKQFEELKLVLINHGEIKSKEEFSKRVLNEVDTKNVGLLGRDYFFRINPYGLVKTLSTKFD